MPLDTDLPVETSTGTDTSVEGSDSDSNPTGDTDTDTDTDTDSDSDSDSETVTDTVETDTPEDTTPAGPCDPADCADLGTGATAVAVQNNACAVISVLPGHLDAKNITVQVEGVGGVSELPLGMDWCNNGTGCTGGGSGTAEFNGLWSPSVSIGPMSMLCPVVLTFKGAGSQELTVKYY